VPISSVRIDPLPRQGIVGALNEALNASGQVNIEGFVQDVLRLAYAVMPLGERAPYIVPTGPRHVSASDRRGLGGQQLGRLEAVPIGEQLEALFFEMGMRW
jgi:hypothetical protein